MSIQLINCCYPLRLPLEGAVRRTEGVLLKLHSARGTPHPSRVARHLLLKEKADLTDDSQSNRLPQEGAARRAEGETALKICSKINLSFSSLPHHREARAPASSAVFDCERNLPA